MINDFSEVVKLLNDFNKHIGDLQKGASIPEEKKKVVEFTDFITMLKTDSFRVYPIHNQKISNEKNYLVKIEEAFNRGELDLVLELAKKLKTSTRFSWLMTLYSRTLKEENLILADKICEVFGVYLPFEIVAEKFKKALAEKNEPELIKTAKLFSDDNDRIYNINICVNDITSSSDTPEEKYNKICILQTVYQTTVTRGGQQGKKKGNNNNGGQRGPRNN